MNTGRAGLQKLRVGLVLGSGGARGIAHIVALETLDKLGIRPVEIAGASIGAILGAAYASGISGKALRTHALSTFSNRTDVMARLFQTRVGKFSDLWRGGMVNPVLVDGEAILDKFLPRALPERFDTLEIPLSVVAADIHRLERVVLCEGALMPAIAASMAIPGLVRPVSLDNRILVDGGAVDPLPVGAIRAPVDIILAIDVGRAASRDEGEKMPGSTEVVFRTFDLIQAALADARMLAPSALVHRIRAPVDRFGALDFFAARRILAASEAMADEIEAVLKAISLQTHAAPEKMP